jgi:prepilin-type N-terminal cleavage/methylation domain-containing protein
MRTRGKIGFTFIEIMTVLALIAVLVAIAWGRFNRSYERALEATMISDLRNLMTAQELYYRPAQTYAPDISLINIAPSPRSSIHITESSPMGWAAWNEIERALKKCELYIGNATPAIGIATESARIFCAVP